MFAPNLGQDRARIRQGRGHGVKISAKAHSDQAFRQIEDIERTAEQGRQNDVRLGPGQKADIQRGKINRPHIGFDPRAHMVNQSRLEIDGDDTERLVTIGKVRTCALHRVVGLRSGACI